MASRTENEPPVIIRFRNSLACVQCRSRHVKCDANKPGCNRCRIDGKTCYFVKSRRGVRNKVSMETAPSAELQPAPSSVDERLNLKASPHTTIPSPGTPPHPPFSAPSTQYTAYHTSSLPVGSPLTSNTAESELEKHITLYYNFFHNAHPWVLPAPRLEQLMKTDRNQVQGLLTVMDFIGSTFTTEGQSDSLRERAVSTMSVPSLPKTAFTVQALLILSVGVHCCTDFQLARNTLDRAIDIAMEIGMHLQSFAVANGNGDAVMEESWRRTFWGMFVVEGTIEAIRKTYSFKLWHLHADVGLPCEELEYRTEIIPQSRTLAEYNERDLAEHEISYSSFTYLIDIFSILGSIMATLTTSDEITNALIDDADGNLVNWKFHLPEDKKDILKENGEIDEPLFQAHMNYNVTLVYLHRLRSRLIHSPIENIAKCAPPQLPFDVPNLRRSSYWLSTKKTLDAAENAINLFTLPTTLAKHTPMIVCGVVLSILAQLSACSYVLQGPQCDAARNRIRLGIGTLKEYGKIWPVGHQSLIEVKKIAREVFAMAVSRKIQIEEPDFLSDAMQLSEPLDIQSYFDEFGALDYFSVLDIPPSS